MSEKERLLIWGAGAIGGIVVAYLKRAGHDVTMVDVTADHVAAISDPQRGLTIEGPIDNFTVVVPAFTPEHLNGTWDCVLLAVKGQYTETACRSLLKLLSPGGFVVSLQNGLCESEIAGIVGSQRTIGCFVNFAGDVLSPGVIRYGQQGYLAVGELNGDITKRLTRLVKVLQDFEPNAFASEEVNSYRWGKLGFSALLFGTALCASPMVPLLEDRTRLPVWRVLCGEVMAVAKAEGVAPRGFDGFDPQAFMPGATEAAAWACIQDMLKIMRPSAKTHSGYWRDIAVHKKRTEIGVQIPPVVSAGLRHGLPCPTLLRVGEMISEIEDGKRAQNDENPLELLPVAQPS